METDVEGSQSRREPLNVCLQTSGEGTYEPANADVSDFRAQSQGKHAVRGVFIR